MAGSLEGVAGRKGDLKVVLSYEEFLMRAADRGEVVNTMFEERLFGLVAALRRITDVLAADQIPYEVIGGLAVLIHIEEANPEYTSLTRDVDLMVRRQDLCRQRSRQGCDSLDLQSGNNATHSTSRETNPRSRSHGHPSGGPAPNETHFIPLERSSPCESFGRRGFDHLSSGGSAYA